PPLVPFGGCGRGLGPIVGFAQVVPDHDEPVRLRVRQGTDKEGIEGTEHGGEAADTERQRCDGDGREARIAAEVTPGISNILYERFGPVGWPNIAAVVLDLLRGAELQADLAARIVLTDARAHHIGDSFFDMEAQ